MQEVVSILCTYTLQVSHRLNTVVPGGGGGRGGRGGAGGAGGAGPMLDNIVFGRIREGVHKGRMQE